LVILFSVVFLFVSTFSSTKWLKIHNSLNLATDDKYVTEIWNKSENDVERKLTIESEDNTVKALRYRHTTDILPLVVETNILVKTKGVHLWTGLNMEPL